MSKVQQSHFLFSDMFVHSIHLDGENLHVFDKNRNMHADPGELILHCDKKGVCQRLLCNQQTYTLINECLHGTKERLEASFRSFAAVLRGKAWDTSQLAKDVCVNEKRSDFIPVNNKEIGTKDSHVKIIDFNEDGLTDYASIELTPADATIAYASEEVMVISAGEYVDAASRIAGGLFDPCFATARPDDKNYKDYLKRFDTAPAPKGKTTSPKGVSI